MKRCTNCDVTKPLSEFYQKRRKGRLSVGYRSTCKVCDANLNKERFATEKHKKYKADYDRSLRERIGDKLRQKSRDYYARTKNARRAKVKAWQHANPDKHNSYSAQGKIVKLRACPSWVDRSEIQSVYARAKREGKQVDHIVPLRNPQVCGLHVPWNLQLLTKTENCSKNNRFATYEERGVPLQR